MSIKQCRAVRAIAEHGSFAAAARALNVAQSAISMQVATFEETLGVPLFDRDFRPPRLTDAGRTVLAHARIVVDEYDKMVDTLSKGPASGGPLRIGVIPTVLTNILPAALIALRAHPSAPNVQVSSDLSGDLMRAVVRGELDAALIHRPDEVPEDHHWTQIARQRIVVIAPPASTETELGAIFAAHPYIRFNRSARVAPMIETRLAELGLPLRASTEIQSIEAIRLLVALGFGASILPAVPDRLQVRDGGPAEAVRVLPFGEPPLFRTIGFLMRSTLARRQIARTVSNAFLSAVGEPALP
jgi:DNA-binding transcriptional LysR family regulator